jgi:hypothetical protein
MPSGWAAGSQSSVAEQVQPAAPHIIVSTLGSHSGFHVHFLQDAREVADINRRAFVGP